MAAFCQHRGTEAVEHAFCRVDACIQCAVVFDAFRRAARQLVKHEKLRQVRRDDLRQRDKLRRQCVCRVFRQEPCAAGCHDDGIDDDMCCVVDGKSLRDCSYQFCGSNHAYFDRIRTYIRKYCVYLHGKELGCDLHDTRNTGGILGSKSGYCTHGVYTVHDHGLDVSLYSGASAGIAPCDR